MGASVKIYKKLRKATGRLVMKKICIVLILMAGAALTGCQNEKVETIEPSTQVIEVNQNGIDVFGSVEADRVKQIHIEFPATIESIEVKVGECVKKGDKLMTLNFEAYQNQIRKKEQEIKQLQVQLSAKEQNLDPASIEANQIKDELNLKKSRLTNDTEPEITMLKQQIVIAQENLRVAQKEYEAQRELLNIGGVSSHELETKELNLKELQKKQDDAVSNLAKVKNTKELEIETLQASYKSKELQVSNTSKQDTTDAQLIRLKIQTAEIELQDMKAKLAKSYLQGNAIIADEDLMVIDEVSVQNGTLLSADETKPILTLINQGSLIVTVDVPESFINKVKIGSHADVKLYADREKTLNAKVKRIANKASMINGETMIKVDLEIEGDTSMLRKGYEVDATIY